MGIFFILFLHLSLLQILFVSTYLEMESNGFRALIQYI